MRRTEQHIKLHRMVMIAAFCALAYIAMLVFHIKVSFLTMDIKDAIIALCGLYFGPLAALAIAVIVPLLEFITISDTGVYGLIMNILSSVVFSLTVSLFYRWKKTIWGAVCGLLSGVVLTTAVMLVANLLITPLFMKTTVEVVKSLIPTLLLPFNLLKSVVNAGAVLLLYKPVKQALRKVGAFGAKTPAPEQEGQTPVASGYHVKTGILVSVAAVVLIAGALVLIFTVLGGQFFFGK